MFNLLGKKLLSINKILLGLALLTPLVVSKLYIQPFVTPRTLYFRIIVELLLVFYLWLVAKQPKYQPNWKHPFVYSVLIFTLAMILSGIFGAQWNHSFWGTLSRSGGIFNWLHFLVYFLILISVLKDKVDWTWFLKIFAGVTFLVSLYAWAQRMGISAVYESGVYRLTGTIGNAAFLAGLLLFGIFAFLYLFVSSKDKYWRVYYIVGAISNLMIMALSQTRGTMLGLATAVFLGFIILSFSQKQVGKKAANIYRVILLLSIIFVIGIFSFRDSAFVKHNTLLNRFTSIDLSDTTTQTRLYAWRGGLEAFKDKPIFGWGVDNFNIAYNHYFDAGFYNYVQTESWFDRAHNQLIEYLTTTGVIGLLSYLLIWYFAVASIFKLRKKEKIDHYQTILLLGVLVAYFVHNLLVFDSVSTLLSFFFVLAFIYFLDQGDSEEVEDKKSKTYAKILPWLALILLLVINIKINIPLDLSAKDAREVMQQFEYKNYTNNSVYDRMDKSLDRNLPWNWELISHYESPIINLIREPGAPVDFDRALQSVKNIESKISKLDNHSLEDSKIYYIFSRIYTLLVEVSPSEYYKERAEYYLSRAIELSPERLPAMYVSAQLKVFEGDYDGAAKIMDQAIAINPNIAQTYWSYALIYSERPEDQDRMFTYIKEAVAKKMTFTNITYIENILPIFQQDPIDYDSLEYLYTQAINLDRKDPQWYASLAAVYKEKGEKEKAIDTVKKILEIDPEYQPQVLEFIKDLE